MGEEGRPPLLSVPGPAQEAPPLEATFSTGTGAEGVRRQRRACAGAEPELAAAGPPRGWAVDPPPVGEEGRPPLLSVPGPAQEAPPLEAT
ncbi:hypothetical protein ACIRDW_44285, partial [Amycolatopsis thermoflava]